MAKTHISANQVLQHAYNEATEKLKVEADIVATIPAAQQVEISQLDDSIRIGDGTTLFTGTTIGPDTGLDVNVLNSITTTPVGLSTDIRQQRVTVGDVATKVPASPLSGRNTITIRILGTSVVYIGDSSVTTTGATGGYPKFQYEEVIVDVRDNASVEIYAICATGESCELAILELA